MEPDLGVKKSTTPSSISDLLASPVPLVGKAIDSTFPIDSPSITISHFNPTFEGSVELVVELSTCVLDLERHSTIFFKENVDLKFVKSAKTVRLIEASKGHLAYNDHGSEGKGGVVRSGTLNKTIQDRGVI
ncbi:hypothetical protein GOBAR_AA22825 [Gossypium barbadense]|uniref:Uncharacterized protein n=1 Tax=Gossypium barbadense TaxID=3634 RepID=A0A2P5X3B5_GOSBA|nr:hypothetical protein GOBAR_AA22825 [Gossypium barbadense]